MQQTPPRALRCRFVKENIILVERIYFRLILLFISHFSVTRQKIILRAFGVSQLYQWYTNIVQGFTNGTIGNTFCTNGNANGTIGSPNGTIGTIGKPMVPLVSQLYHWLPMVPLVKITNGTIGRTPDRAIIKCFKCVISDRSHENTDVRRIWTCADNGFKWAEVSWLKKLPSRPVPS